MPKTRQHGSLRMKQHILGPYDVVMCGIEFKWGGPFEYSYSQSSCTTCRNNFRKRFGHLDRETAKVEAVKHCPGFYRIGRTGPRAGKEPYICPVFEITRLKDGFGFIREFEVQSAIYANDTDYRVVLETAEINLSAIDNHLWNNFHEKRNIRDISKTNRRTTRTRRIVSG